MERKIKRIIEEIARSCSEDLAITCPKITFGIDKKSKNNISLLILDENLKPTEIQITNEEREAFDLFLAMAHEMRHVYQFERNPKMWNSYRTIEECETLEIYNLQDEEIDANAYAALFIEANFGVTPLFNGYSESVKSKIVERKEEIIKETKNDD